MLVVASPQRAEQAGEITCPGCRGALRPFGRARARTVRGMGAERLTVTPRRARCAATHVLLPGALSVRRADSTEAIGSALLAKAGGAGHRSIAAQLHRPVSTVRRWLRGARGEHAEWLYQRGVQRAARLNRELLATQMHPFKSTLWHALNILAGLARHSREHLGVTDPPWSLICLYAEAGRLLAPPAPSTA